MLHTSRPKLRIRTKKVFKFPHAELIAIDCHCQIETTIGAEHCKCPLALSGYPKMPPCHSSVASHGAAGGSEVVVVFMTMAGTTRQKSRTPHHMLYNNHFLGDGNASGENTCERLECAHMI